MLHLFLAFLLSEANAQEVATPATLLGPRHFNHHAFNAERYLQDLKNPTPTKKGPVLFPNDGPPRLRTPLIVTSRPLLESIANSDLNNTLPSPSHLSQVAYKPAYLARLNEYKPFVYNVPVTFGYEFGPTQTPYTGLNDGYDNYEERTLSPIHQAFSDHAQQRLLKVQERPNQYNYQVQTLDYPKDYESKNVDDGSSKDYTSDHGENYAFAYAVKDQKTGDDFSHSQSSSGSATNGEYRVRLPDGRMQIVSYTADENGYKADVRYDDEGKTEVKNIDNRHIIDYTDNHQNDYNVNRQNDYDSNDHYSEKSNKYNDNNYNSNAVQSSDKTNDYTVQDKRYKSSHDYYNYPDVSKEYGDDYSSEYNSNYVPHKSKFSSFVTNIYDTVTVKPTYEELKHLLVDKSVYSARQIDNISPTVSSTAANPSYDATTEKVVIIGTPRPNLFTNIKNFLSVSPSPYTNHVVSSTPRNYLVSTIANLKNRINLSNKPILSDNFLDKINKYLTYK